MYNIALKNAQQSVDGVVCNPLNELYCLMEYYIKSLILKRNLRRGYGNTKDNLRQL